MNTTILTFSTLTIICIVVAIFLIKKEARRLLNALFLGAAIVLLALTISAIITISGNIELGYKLITFCLYSIYVIIFISGMILILNCCIVIQKEGISLANILPFFFGIIAFISAYAGYQEMIMGVSGSEAYVIVMSIFYKVALYVPFLILAIIIYSIVYLCLPKDSNAKYIIVLGCSIKADGEVTPLLRCRLDKAISWYKKGGEVAKFVVSGGQGNDEIISEAQAMQNYLISQNISEDKILMENKSVNTRENLLFSNKIIENDGGGSTLICTSNYHVLRSVIFAKNLGIDAQGIGGHTALYYLPVAFFREYIAMIFKYKTLILIYLLIVIVSEIIVFI